MVSAHFLPGIVMFLYLVIGENVPLAVALLIIVMAFNGASVVTTIVNAQDLAPNFAGTQFGIMNFFGSMPGFIIPAMVGEITKNKVRMKLCSCFVLWKSKLYGFSFCLLI